MRPTITHAAAMAAAMACATPALASEFGQSEVDLGYMDTLVGVIPGPGLYGRSDFVAITSGRLDDRNGNPEAISLPGGKPLPIRFRETIVGDLVSGVYIPDLRLPYGMYVGSAFYVFAGSARVGVETSIGYPQSVATTKGGIGDLTVVPAFLAFTIGKPFHVILAPLDFTAPTGRYDPNDRVGNNLGLNHWSWRPAIEATYLDAGGRELDMNANVAVNGRNPASGYRSGSEFSFTWAAQQYLSPRFGFGIGGYYYKQFTDDTLHGVVVDATPATDPLDNGPGNRGETFAFGPILSWNPTKALRFQAHWDHDAFAYDRARRDEFWTRVQFAF